jgi:predicted nucleic acid-binding protein
MLANRFRDGEIVTCSPVVLEVMHRARSGDEYEMLCRQLFEPLDWLPLDATSSSRAVQVQREMAQTSHSNHLRPATDYLIAAIAEAAGAEIVLWCFDKDLKIICEHTGQRCEPEAT